MGRVLGSGSKTIKNRCSFPNCFHLLKFKTRRQQQYSGLQEAEFIYFSERFLWEVRERCKTSTHCIFVRADGTVCICSLSQGKKGTDQ